MKEYAEVAEKIAKDYYDLLSRSQRFSWEKMQQIKSDLDTQVHALLDIQKPKIMVYGIYNSGKSTLVNALCGKQVAAVADRPMTDTVTEYDQGRYILIDSPGVNAPIQHEIIADKHLTGCHAILFVISSKGMFEDRVNYEKLLNLLQKNIPFYIILNDRGFQTVEDAEINAKTEQEHNRELAQIKEKIIQNLVKISGDQKIADKYHVIELNAKRAWTGIRKEKPALLQKSNLTVLQRRLDEILEEKQYWLRLLAPISNLEQLIYETENALYEESDSDDYGERRALLLGKIENFRQDLFSEARAMIAQQSDHLTQMKLKGETGHLGDIWNDLLKQIDDIYISRMKQLQYFVKERFAEVQVDSDKQDGFDHVAFDIDSVEYAEQKNTPEQHSFCEDLDLPEIKDGIFDKILDFCSPSRKQEREFARMEREVAIKNARAEWNAVQQIQKQQDARMYATCVKDEMNEQLRKALTAYMQNDITNILCAVDSFIQQKQNISQQTQEILSVLNIYHKKLAELRERVRT